ncbi:hypothetical protein K491DRAFT_466842 [Lophiostoma macrostomum CBS 122681]|uniref:Piwi domain-containing protein n=1 Tax=Lophiostoma macrostomum CBS 122681 TaxID=1314788 RepID=A0A6A6T3G3_9PLEO|nr:hypothetical protein K491DRAFT_466842 [Lophiostoma macrostomum CBS 122681]
MTEPAKVFQFDQTKPEYSPAWNPNGNATEDRLPAEKTFPTGRTDTQHLRIVFVTSRESSQANAFIDRIKHALRSPLQQRILFDPTMLHAVVPSLQDLIRQNASANSPLMRATVQGNCTAVLGVIDRTGISNAKYREIKAEMNRFGTRKPSVITVSVDKKHLETFLNREQNSLFPLHILQKMNFMLCKTNWTFDSNRANDPDSLSLNPSFADYMVVGAHVCHPNSSSTEFCPSVAAVIASSDPEALFFPGSMRLQPSHKRGNATTSSENNTEQPARGIEGLEDMMKERFLVWNRKLAPKLPHVIQRCQSYLLNTIPPRTLLLVSLTLYVTYI